MINGARSHHLGQHAVKTAELGENTLGGNLHCHREVVGQEACANGRVGCHRGVSFVYGLVAIDRDGGRKHWLRAVPGRRNGREDGWLNDGGVFFRLCIVANADRWKGGLDRLDGAAAVGIALWIFVVVGIVVFAEVHRRFLELGFLRKLGGLALVDRRVVRSIDKMLPN